MSTMPRKGTRRIVVDGVRFRWKLTRKHGWAGSDSAPMKMRVLIQAEDKPGSLLDVQLISNQWDPIKHGDDDSSFKWRYSGDQWMFHTHKATLKPVDVEWLIRAGLDAGWIPNEGRGLFPLVGPVSCGDYDVPQLMDGTGSIT